MKQGIEEIKLGIEVLPEDQVNELVTFTQERSEKLKAERQERVLKARQAKLLAELAEAQADCERNGIEFKIELPQLGRPKRRKKKKAEAKKAA